MTAAGVEPATQSLGNSCSIQLSYAAYSYSITLCHSEKKSVASKIAFTLKAR